MNNSYISKRPKLYNCLCGCHNFESNENKNYLNLNKSQIIHEPIPRNINFLNYNYSDNEPLYYCKSSENFNTIKYNTNYCNNNINNKYYLKEKAQQIKDKVNSIFLLKKINENKKFNQKNDFNSFNDLNIISKNTFYNKGKSPKYNDIKIENPYLKQLLKSVPRHEKNKKRVRPSDEKMKLIFSNGLYRMKSNNYIPSNITKYNKNIYNNKKFNGYNSMVMPANDINKINII